MSTGCAARFEISEPSPLVDMNTTPLIDVLLVLIIMMIITIPPQSHAVKVDLPTKSPSVVVERLSNEVVVTRDDRLLWNGTVISSAALGTALARAGAMQPAPEIHLRPEAQARYEIVDGVLAAAKRANVRAFGFVGNERYSSF